MEKDVRWVQRLENFETALKILEEAVALAHSRELSELENQGLIQAFEFTHELAWNLLKDYFDYQGTAGITGSRDATREAFNKGLLSNGAPWMEMIRSRNDTSHTYNKTISAEIIKKIRTLYIHQFIELKNKMQSLKSKS